MTRAEVDRAAASGLQAGETLASVAAYPAHGIGQTVVQTVAHWGDDNSRAYVVDEDGVILETQAFWARERAARFERFGRLAPALFDKTSAMAPTESVEVDIMVRTDLPEPQLPYDGTDTYVPIEEFEDWTRDHANAQVARITIAKQRVLDVLADHGGVVRMNPRGLPTLRAAVSVELLRASALNASDVVRIREAIEQPPGQLSGYAARRSMGSPNAGGIGGGVCGGLCSGGGIDVGYWERDGDADITSGLARNNTRVAAYTVTGYLGCPTLCTTDQECEGTSDVTRRCRAQPDGESICVQDHLTWVVASVGMSGSYSYDTIVPNGADPVPNSGSCSVTFNIGCLTAADCPSGQTCVVNPFNPTGTFSTDKRFGNSLNVDGLDYLIAPPPGTSPCEDANPPPTPYVNRSASNTPDDIDFAGRAFGTFVTAAAGNLEDSVVACAVLKNGLCVGMFDYHSWLDLTSHRRTTDLGPVGSSFLNNTTLDPALERPHLLGPGNHNTGQSGLNLPDIEVPFTPTASLMRHADYTPIPNPIIGTSFAAPTVLSAAIQAHQYEGWFSDLAFPMANKAVLMAATQDANADGRVGVANTWSANAPTVDAEDGAGQINLTTLKTILTNNTYSCLDLQDASFSSCGTGCRRLVVLSNFTIPAHVKFRAALAWQSCMIEEEDVPVLNNDLDLVLGCGSPLMVCGGTTQSNTVTSELEMFERPACIYSKTCTLAIHVKNGATLQSCGSTTFERVGVAWSFL